jgi:hypothetical protein
MKATPVILLVAATCAFGKEPLFLLHEIDRQPTESIMVMDFDGDQDIVVGGLTGQYWFENLLINKAPNKQRDVLTNRFPSKL